MVKVDRLIIVGGPACAGKSYLIDKVQQGACSDLCTQLDIDNPLTWGYLAGGQLTKMARSAHEAVMVHYDFYGHYLRYEYFTYLNELLQCSDHITVLTLCVPPQTLTQRNKIRILRHLKQLLWNPPMYQTHWYGLRRSLVRHRLYSRNYSKSLYKEWLQFMDRRNLSNHWILESDTSDPMLAYRYDPNMKEQLT